MLRTSDPAAADWMTPDLERALCGGRVLFGSASESLGNKVLGIGPLPLP